MFSQASTGYSDPTNFETLPFEDGADASATLLSERARSLEVGLRRHPWVNVLYRQHVQNSIVEQVDSLGISTFVNADAPLHHARRRDTCPMARNTPSPCPWPPRGSITF